MKKEVKSSVSPSPGQAQAKASLVKEEPGSGAGAGAGAGASPPSIKADPDAPLVNGENTIVNNSSNNNCDNSTPGTPASGAGVGGGPGELTGGGPGSERDATTPSSVEDKKPVIGGSGPPSNCATGNGLIKSETDFLDTFDSKDGGKCQHSFFFFKLPNNK